MISPRPIVWRIAAALFWITSAVCFYLAVTGAANAEGWATLAPLSPADQRVIQHMTQVADRWAAAGWLLQLITAALLSFSLKSPRPVRRLFVALVLLIAIDSVTLLLSAILLHF